MSFDPFLILDDDPLPVLRRVVQALVLRLRDVGVSLAGHLSDPDPHPQYATDTDLNDHLTDPDAHPQYQKESEKGNPNGYAGLDGSGKVPAGQLPDLAGDASGPVTATVVGALRGRAVASTAPLDRQVLAWDQAAGHWTPRDAPRWEPVTNGDPVNPELVFDDGDVVMELV